MASEQTSGAQIHRESIIFSGPENEQLDFLQSLVTNDVSKATGQSLVYAALLTPQGKYLSDFFIRKAPDGNFILDVAPAQADALAKRLTMYKLRRPVTLTRESAPVTVLWGGGANAPEQGLRDPRDPDMGWRIYDGDGSSMAGVSEGDYDLHRLKLGVPEADTDLIANDTYILEAGFERMNGVDFKKGCYVGQEIVARMKHKTELRKKYARVAVSGSAEPGAVIQTEDNKPAGVLYSARDGIGLALIRTDRAEKAALLMAGAAMVSLI